MIKTQKKKFYRTTVAVVLTLLFIIWISAFSYAQFKITRIECDHSIFEFQDKEILFQPIFSYNRVQGPLLGLNLSLYLKKLWLTKITGNLGYGFENGRRYHAGIQRSFFVTNPLTIGFAYYDQIYSLDEWFIGNIENSLAALFIKEDFMDYFGKRGLLAFVDKKFADFHTVRIEVEQFQFESLSRHTNWALFGKKKRFQENPSVIEEKTTSVRLMWIFDWQDNSLSPTSGWYFEGLGEQTFGDSVDVQGLFITLKCFQPTFGSQLLKLKLMIGGRNGCDQRYEQYLMDMGGIGTLVGYEDKEFKNGNRFLYLTAHYLFNGAILNRLPLDFLPLFDQLTLGVFSEGGWLYFGDKNKNPINDFSSLKMSDLKSDVGLSLYVVEQLARIDFAKRTDRSKDAWRITIRFMHKF